MRCTALHGLTPGTHPHAPTHARTQASGLDDEAATAKMQTINGAKQAAMAILSGENPGKEWFWNGSPKSAGGGDDDDDSDADDDWDWERQQVSERRCCQSQSRTTPM